MDLARALGHGDERVWFVQHNVDAAASVASRGPATGCEGGYRSREAVKTTTSLVLQLMIYCLRTGALPPPDALRRTCVRESAGLVRFTSDREVAGTPRRTGARDPPDALRRTCFCV